MLTIPQGQEGKWLADAVAGNSEALAALLGQFTPMLRRKLSTRIPGRLRAEVEVEDILQVTYFEAFLRIDQLETREIPGFAAWLLRVAESNLKDAIRFLSRAKRLPPDKRISPTDDDCGAELVDALRVVSTTPSRLVARDEAYGFLNEYMKRLPEDYRRVLLLYEIEERSASEVAGIMGRSVGAVYMLRARALERLRDVLGTESRFFSKKA